MESAHTGRIDIVILCRLADTVVELLDYPVSVGKIVPLSVDSSIPFCRSSIIDQKRLAMACGYHDSPLVRHHLTLRMAVEGSCTGMHGWSNHIGLEPQQKLANLVICLRTDIAQLLLEIAL